MKCSIETITPVHIGNGKDYGPSEYYRGKSTKGNPILVKTDLNQVFTSLSEDKKDEFIQHLTDPTFQLGDYLKNVLGKKPPKIKKYLAILMCKNPYIIEEHIKTAEKPYIPGSSIKGAIRTAMLHNIIAYKDIREIKKLIQRNRVNFWKSQRFHDQFFSNPQKNDPKYNILKFLQVTDTGTFSYPSIYSIVTFKAGERRNEWYSRGRKIVYVYAETIGTGKKLEFEINSDYNPQLHGELYLQDKEQYLHIKKIKEFLFKFSRDYINHEIDFAQKYSIDFLEKFYSKLKSKNSPESPLMRIGYGSGFLSTTIGLRLKKEDPETYEMVRKTFRRAYPFEFPKTRKLTGQKKPLGWVKVSTNG
ncbi:MAG: type III-A CRISPR-associated RAMP protein Csm5 [Methanobacteriaceae archaeon]|jgi:CRISPR type III-A-associated RAMP protein Csm5